MPITLTPKKASEKRTLVIWPDLNNEGRDSLRTV